MSLYQIFTTLSVLVLSSCASQQQPQRDVVMQPKYRVLVAHTNNKQEVEINVGNIESLPDQHIQALASALDNDRASPKFRVNWNVQVLSRSEEGTVLFDRKNKALEVHRHGSMSGQRIHFEALFTNVDETIIQETARRITIQDGGNYEFWKVLPELGAKQRKIKP